MWLRDLKRENVGKQDSATSPLADAQPLHKQRYGLSRLELDRLIQRTRELRDELTAGIHHIDPAEYSDERIQQLLAQAKKK